VAELQIGTFVVQTDRRSHAEIKSMHTAEAARGRGVGRAMVNHLTAFAQEHNSIELEKVKGTS
jgi:putative acetyltransferase